jgi:hypothetical protein
MRERAHLPPPPGISAGPQRRQIKRIQAAYGRDAFAVVSTGQLLTEEFYTLGKLVRGQIGTNNYDGNTTLCMASAVSGYKRSFGSDGPRLLRGLRAHRLPAGVRLQPAGAAPDHLLAAENGAGTTQVPGHRGRPARHHVRADGRHASGDHAGHRRGLLNASPT